MKLVKTILYILIVLVIIGGAAWILKSNKEKNEQDTAIVAEKNPETVVNAVIADYNSVNTDYISNGIFAPYQELSFPSEISGRITRVFVTEGNYVSVGQTLATIKKDALEVDNSNARAVYENAVIENQRYENAYKTGGVTQQQVDNSRIQLKNAKAALEQTNLRVGDTNVKATISGIINKRHIEPGSVVAPGTPMFDIVNVSRLVLKVNVVENQVVNLKVGDNIKVTASVFPDKEFVGKITFIAPLADASLNFPVEIEVTNSDKQLRAGMYGTAVFSSKDDGKSTSVLTLPKEAFVNGISSKQVFVVNPDNTVKLTQLVTGRVFGDQVEVISGIEKGQTVVTTGQINLADGAKVKVVK